MYRHRLYYVYILASRRNGTLYTGVTAHLANRVWQHKNDIFEGFTKRYGVHLLVWFEVHEDIHEANGLRNATITLVTFIGIAIFARAGVIRWLPSLVMMAGATLGGYGMGRFARRMPQHIVRRAILVWAVLLTAVAFWRYS